MVRDAEEVRRSGKKVGEGWKYVENDGETDGGSGGMVAWVR